MPDGSIPTSDWSAQETGNKPKLSGANVIVVGNEKGGAGKSTVSMHLSVALEQCGLTVGALDLDIRQRTFTRYFENREQWADRTGMDLNTPMMRDIPATDLLDGTQDRQQELFHKHLSALAKFCDVIIIDSPGSYTPLSRCAHSHADIIVTPMNESFVDFDLLADIDIQTMKINKPSLYSEMVAECRKERATKAGRPIDWLVIRNRMSVVKNSNIMALESSLEELAGRIGFRLTAGLSERMVYRELFSKGLTLLDLAALGGLSINMSHVAARQELRDLVSALNLPALVDKPLGF